MNKKIQDDIATLLETMLEAFPDKIIIEANIVLYKKRIFPHHFLGLQVFGYSYQKTIEQLGIEAILRSSEKISSVVPSDMNIIEKAINGILVHKKRDAIYYDGRITHEERVIPELHLRKKVGLLYPYKITFARDVAISWLIRKGYLREIDRYFGFRSEWVFYLKKKNSGELIISLDPKINGVPTQTSFLFKAFIDILRQYGEVAENKLKCVASMSQIVSALKKVGYHDWIDSNYHQIPDMKSNLVKKILPQTANGYFDIGNYNRKLRGYPLSITLPL